jgi:hypothetical protein
VTVLDLGTPISGDIYGHLVPYTLELNLSLIEFAFSNVPFLQTTPQSVLEEQALYPDSTLCVGLPRIRRPSGRIGGRP